MGGLIASWWAWCWGMPFDAYLITGLVILGIALIVVIGYVGFTWDDWSYDWEDLIEFLPFAVAFVFVVGLWPVILFLLPFVLVAGAVGGLAFAVGYYIRTYL